MELTQSARKRVRKGHVVLVFLRRWQTRKRCGNIIAHDLSLRTQNVSGQNQKNFLCPKQMLRARANGETFVSATMCPLSV